MEDSVHREAIHTQRNPKELYGRGLRRERFRGIEPPLSSASECSAGEGVYDEEYDDGAQERSE